MVVSHFVVQVMQPSQNGDWSEQVQRRRAKLIDKDIAGSATVAEQAELTELDRLANEHFDKAASPPIEGARRLHQQLLQSRGRRK